MKKLSPKIVTLHEQFSRYGRNAREWTRKCVLLLPEIERNRVWEKKGFCSIYEYAAKLAGMSREAVNDSLRILRKIEDKPLLMEIVEQKGINCIKPIVNLVSDGISEKFWTEKARIMSRHTLETYIRELKKIGDNKSEMNSHCDQDGLFEPKDDVTGRTGPSETPNFPQKKAILILVEPEVAEQLEKLKAQNDWNTLMKEFLKLREEKLAAELKEIEQKKIKKILKKKKAVISKNDLYKAKSRPVPIKIKKYAFHKTNHTCAFPGCTKPAEHLHHTDRFAIIHRHDPEKIIPLCKAHHDLAHDGLIENEEEMVERWKITRTPDQNDYKSVINQRVMAYRTDAQK